MENNWLTVVGLIVVLLVGGLVYGYSWDEPQYVTPAQMEASVDEFQEKYDVDEEMIAPCFRNSDPKDWRK